MNIDPSVRDAVLAAVPSLRAFAISLCGNVDRAAGERGEDARGHEEAEQPGGEAGTLRAHRAAI